MKMEKWICNKCLPEAESPCILTFTENSACPIKCPFSPDDKCKAVWNLCEDESDKKIVNIICKDKKSSINFIGNINFQIPDGVVLNFQNESDEDEM